MKCKNVGLVSLFCLCCVFISCKDKEICTGVIYTYMQNEQGFKTLLGECELVFGESDYSPDMKRTVTTDAKGCYEGTWQREAYLPIVARKTVGDNYYKGVGYIRLEAGNKVIQEIILE